MAAALIRVYNQSFERRPYATLACSNSVLNVMGDGVAQVAESYTGGHTWQYDPLRAARFAVFGFGMGPVIGRWIKFLEVRFPFRAPPNSGATLLQLGKRVLSDQVVMAPVGLVLFLGSMGIMEGRSTEQIKNKYRDVFAPALLTNWKVWPVIQVVNFRFMPLPLRVPFQSSCGIFWTLYLSLLNQAANQHHPKTESKTKTA